MLFADAAALAAEPGVAGPARDAVRAVAAHLADLVRHAQARGAAMPDGLEPAVTALALQALEADAAGPDGKSCP